MLSAKAERGGTALAKGRVAILHVWLASSHCSQQQVRLIGFLFRLILGLVGPAHCSHPRLLCPSADPRNYLIFFGPPQPNSISPVDFVILPHSHPLTRLYSTRIHDMLHMGFESSI